MITPPPRWTTAQFEETLSDAIEAFREERLTEDLSSYTDIFEEARQAVTTLLELTVDLSEVKDRALEVATDAALLEALRYLAGPPISEDDLKTLANTNTLTASRLRAEPARAEDVVETVLAGLDRNRLPWVFEDREPTDDERAAALVATTALIAARRVITSRANESKTRQEEAIGAALVKAGYQQVAPQTVANYSAAPQAGQFCHESMFGSRKADLVVTLKDGRLMPIEAKVSNSSTNSVKRLNNDAAIKAKTWLHEFGVQQTVPTAVLSGVFKVRNLEAAQGDGLTIFWAHDLDELVKFVG